MPETRSSNEPGAVQRQSLKLSLTVTHAFYAPQPADLRVVPQDPQAFSEAELTVRADGPRIEIYGRADAELPDLFALLVKTSSSDLFDLTPGISQGLVSVQPIWARGNSQAQPQIWRFNPKASDQMPRDDESKNVLAVLNVVPKKDTEGAQNLVVSFDSVAVHWSYAFLGADLERPLRIVPLHTPEADGPLSEGPSSGGPSPEGSAPETISFEDLGLQHLECGQTARVFCSKEPLKAQAVSPNRFSLESSDGTDSKVIVSVLPTAGPTQIRRFATLRGGARAFEALMFVSLF
ncbi:MAG: hypothetical protein AAGD04_11255 [Pseudomonadota bacterium]